jgi:hypothetical protein
LYGALMGKFFQSRVGGRKKHLCDCRRRVAVVCMNLLVDILMNIFSSMSLRNNPCRDSHRWSWRQFDFLLKIISENFHKNVIVIDFKRFFFDTFSFLSTQHSIRSFLMIAYNLFTSRNLRTLKSL